MAIATLGISSEEFYDLDAVEFYNALKVISENRRAQSRESYEVARFGAVQIINMELMLKGRNPIQDPADYVSFIWEKKKEKGQSLEDMKKQVLTLGVLFAGDNPVGHKKLDDPPTVLAHPKEEK